MSDTAVPAWATALVEAINDLRAEMCGEAALTRNYLERVGLAADRMTAAVSEMEAQLTAAEKRLDLRDGPQT